MDKMDSITNVVNTKYLLLMIKSVTFFKFESSLSFSDYFLLYAHYVRKERINFKKVSKFGHLAKNCLFIFPRNCAIIEKILGKDGAI